MEFVVTLRAKWAEPPLKDISSGGRERGGHTPQRSQASRTRSAQRAERRRECGPARRRKTPENAEEDGGDDGGSNRPEGKRVRMNDKQEVWSRGARAGREAIWWIGGQLVAVL